MNPYLSTWLHPRQTIRYIISTGGDYAGACFFYFLYTAAFYLITATGTLYNLPPGKTRNIAMLIIAIGLFINHLIARFFLSWGCKMFARTASWLRSEASVLQIRAAMLWTVTTQMLGAYYRYFSFADYGRS